MDFVFSVGTTDTGKEPPDEGGTTEKKISFKDMVMGNKEAPVLKPKVDLF